MPQTLRKGDSGPAVSRLQRDLEMHGYPVGQVDGIFGKKTDAAVRMFQSDHELVVDGIVGPATWGELEGPVPSVEVTFDLSDFPSLALAFRCGVDDDVNGYLTELGISA
ncbi:peptidoglycan-binding domain-containing protein [Streptomyces sp. NPDC002825]|uniref:peptidoglycan-binding domain-containing protein n=1 Tax=Streptomyces sp. NPDC002825 TaxID=3154666 RepID=UPI00331C8542